MEPMTKRVVSVIPARGGSKGLPGKNLKDLSGRPLIVWTIEASRNAKCITTTVVSSEDPKILDIAESSGARIIRRPLELASDTALTEPVLVHALEHLENNAECFDYLILLQPTSPLRNDKHIDQAFNSLVESGASSLISVVETTDSPLKSFILSDGYLKGIVNDKYPFMRRQDLPVSYHANGAIYIINIEEFKKEKTLLTTKTIPFVMDEISSVDIDIADDLKKASLLINKHNLQN